MDIIEEKFKLKSLDSSVSTRLVTPKDPIAMIVLAHGAGAGINHKFMIEIQQEMGKVGLASFSFNFLYMEEGKRTPYRMNKPMKAWVDVWNHVTATYKLPTFASGKSYGGRVGSMVVDQLEDCKGLIFMGYPFHPAGNTEKLRTEHLYKIDKPMLFLQGSRDALSTQAIANEFTKKHSSSKLVWLEDGEHSWKPRKASGFTQHNHMISACKEMRDFCQKYSK